jgi:hypothetical protein
MLIQSDVDMSSGLYLQAGTGVGHFYRPTGAGNFKLGTISSTALDIQTGNTTAINIDTSQRVGVGTASPDTTITNTKLHIYNGIAAFNATYGIGWIGQSGPTNGTRTSSTIDQYDYGTWNPVFTGASGGNAGTMDTTNQKAYYVRVGKLCIATCYAKQTARAGTPATGNFVITGLPYASTGVGAAAVGRWISFTNSYYSMSGYVADTETQIRMYGQTGVGTSSSVISYADVPANAEIYLTITYRVA